MPHCSSAEKPRLEQRHSKTTASSTMTARPATASILPNAATRSFKNNSFSSRRTRTIRHPSPTAPRHLRHGRDRSSWFPKTPSSNQMSGAGIGLRNFKQLHHREHHGNHIYVYPPRGSPPGSIRNRATIRWQVCPLSIRRIPGLKAMGQPHIGRPGSRNLNARQGAIFSWAAAATHVQCQESGGSDSIAVFAAGPGAGDCGSSRRLCI